MVFNQRAPLKENKKRNITDTTREVNLELLSFGYMQQISHDVKALI